MRLRRPPLVAVVALAAATLIATPVAAAPGHSAAAPGASAASETARARHERVVAFWTPERLRAAIPRDFAFDPVRGFQPVAKPGGGGGGGGVSATTTGASWPNGRGDIYSATGKVYFEMGGVGYVCSGAVVDDARSGASLVLTAAHCAFDESSGRFATEWMFIPQFDSSPTFTCGQTALGCWTADALVVHNGYATAGGFNTQATLHDWAFAVVGYGGKSGTALLENVVDGFGIEATAYPDDTQMYAFGYPAAGKYRGNDLTYCAGKVGSDPYNANLTYRLACAMTGGSSGGPWLSDFNTSGDAGTLSSVNSYGYSGIKAMHGPKFNGDTADTFGAANRTTTTEDTIVP